MKKLRFRRVDLYFFDVAHIVSIMHDAGYEISPEDAEDAWRAFSDSYDATWLLVSAFSPQEIIDAVLSYCDEVQ